MISDKYLVEYKLDPEDPHLQEPGTMLLQSTVDIPPKTDPRDPHGINHHLKLEFSDILAEPSSFRTFDRIWTWSDITFESSRLWCYRIISLLCAVPVSLCSGFLFACLGCFHIWCVMPCIQLCTVALPPVRTLWASILDVLIAPLFTSLGRCCSAIYLTLLWEQPITSGHWALLFMAIWLGLLARSGTQFQWDIRQDLSGTMCFSDGHEPCVSSGTVFDLFAYNILGDLSKEQ